MFETKLFAFSQSLFSKGLIMGLRPGFWVQVYSMHLSFAKPESPVARPYSVGSRQKSGCLDAVRSGWSCVLPWSKERWRDQETSRP